MQESVRDTQVHIAATLHHLEHMLAEPNELAKAPPKARFDIFRRVAKRRELAIGGFGPLTVDLFTVRSGQTIELFKSGMSSKVPAAMLAMTSNKELTKVWLAAHGVPVPRGGVAADVESGLALHAALGRHSVVKPILGTKGRGISVGLTDEHDFRAAFAEAQRFNKRVIVEETVQGIDLRTVVIGGRARAAVLRVPANVVGDGVHTIAELVDAKNLERQRNRYMARYPLRLTNNSKRVLRAKGLDVDSRPAAGTRVFLTLAANVSTGGETINVLDELHPEIVALAERAALCLSRELYVGVDVLLERLDRGIAEQKCVICEINSNAGPNVSRYPTFGPPFDTPSAVFNRVFASVEPALGERDASFAVTGVDDVDGFQSWLRKQLHGSVSVDVTSAHGTLRVTLHGHIQHVEEFPSLVWGWQGAGVERVDGLRRLTPPFEPASQRLPASVRPPPAPTRTGPDPLLTALDERGNSASATESEPLVAAFARHGWRAWPRTGGWYVIDDGSVTGLCHRVQTGTAMHRLARLRYPLLRWLADAGLAVPRHAVFTRGRRAAALAYLQQRDRPQRLRRVWNRPAWSRRDVDEAALTRHWKTWPQRLLALMLEDEIAGQLAGVLVVAGEGYLVTAGSDAITAGNAASATFIRDAAEAVVATLPSLDLAMVWLRIDTSADAATEPSWVVVEVDTDPDLGALERHAPGAGDALADVVVHELMLSDRSYWFGTSHASHETSASAAETPA